MGAEFNFTRLKASNTQEALKQAQDVIDQARWEYGHGGYSGSFAECPGATFDARQSPGNAQEAADWLEEHCEKWEAATVLRCQDGTYVMGALCSS